MSKKPKSKQKIKFLSLKDAEKQRKKEKAYGERRKRQNMNTMIFVVAFIIIAIIVTVITITMEKFEIIKKDKNVVRLVGKEGQNFYDRSKFYQYMTALEDVNTENRIYDARFNR